MNTKDASEQGRDAKREGRKVSRSGEGWIVAEPLMTKNEVCELLRCSPRTLDRWRSMWRARKVDIGEVKIGRRAKFRREKIEKLLESPRMWV
jgi:hypothetical protein